MLLREIPPGEIFRDRTYLVGQSQRWIKVLELSEPGTPIILRIVGNIDYRRDSRHWAPDKELMASTSTVHAIVKNSVYTSIISTPYFDFKCPGFRG